MFRSVLAAFSFGLLVACGAADVDSPSPGSISQGITSTATLFALADTHVRSGSPNKNYGTVSPLLVEKSGSKRALLMFDTVAVQQAIVGRTVVSAYLELTIHNSASGFPTGGVNLIAHRLTQGWTETGATWNCAVDSNTSNGAPDCPSDGWNMGTAPFPWASTGISTHIVAGQTGVLPFDVTADVAAIAAGTTPNHGWLVKRENETLTGSVSFRSREAINPPRLVLTLAGPCGDGTVDAQNAEACDDGNTASGDGCSATCAVEYCGDGATNNGIEECDDGGVTAGDGCSEGCQVEYCGDGVVNNSGTEDCDDGGAISGDHCSAICRDELLYFNDSLGGRLFRSDRAGASEYSIADGGYLGAFDIDRASRKVYFVHGPGDGNYAFERANLDGTNREILNTRFSMCSPITLAFDPGAAKLYWGPACHDVSEPTVWRMNPDGSDLEGIIWNTESAMDVKLDIANGKIYWADGFTTVNRANLDGSTPENVLTIPGAKVKGIAIDSTAGLIYFTDDASNKVRRAPLSGGTVTDLVTSGLVVPWGIAVDRDLGRLYWADWTAKTITSSNLDGSDVLPVITSGFSSARFVVVY